MPLSFLLFALVLILSVSRCVSPSTLYVITEIFTVINKTGVANLASSTGLALGACLLIRWSIGIRRSRKTLSHTLLELSLEFL